MDGVALLLIIVGVIAAYNSSNKKKKVASSAPERKAPAAPANPVPRSPAKPTVAPSVKPVAAKPAPAQKAGETHAHAHTTHVVAPSFYTGHAHEEGSLTGEGIACTPVARRQIPAEAPAAPEKKLELDFDGDSIVKGLVYAEILGKPKALR